jgi:choice-of-anchor A domain-containing protein
MIGGMVIHTNLSTEISAAIAASQNAGGLPCTQTITNIKTAMTITGVVGTNVICVTNVDLSGGKVVTLTGPVGARFIINVTGKFSLSGGSQIRVAGSVQPKDVLYNILGTGEQVAFSGGGGGADCCQAVVDGTLIALKRKIALSPGLVNGQLIGGQDISIVSGSSVRCPSGCTPTSFVNTLTVNAEAACLTGRPITVRSQCSATVECQ